MRKDGRMRNDSLWDSTVLQVVLAVGMVLLSPFVFLAWFQAISWFFCWMNPLHRLCQ
jgi:hypothetical protein